MTRDRARGAGDITDSGGRALIRRSAIEEIGDIPLLRIPDPHLSPRVAIYAKLEGFNPGGSVKDRAALRMIREGERSGQPTRDKVLLDSTSGNTGIVYAMIGAALGYRVRLAMPANVSRERKAILAACGADVVLTDPAEGSDGAIVEAQRLYDEAPERFYKPDQYNNPANWQAHIARGLGDGVVVTVFCDGGDKYMSTPMWGQAYRQAMGAEYAPYR